jgi:hypothetical protein
MTAPMLLLSTSEKKGTYKIAQNVKIWWKKIMVVPA